MFCQGLFLKRQETDPEGLEASILAVPSLPPEIATEQGANFKRFRRELGIFPL